MNGRAKWIGLGTCVGVVLSAAFGVTQANGRADSRQPRYQIAAAGDSSSCAFVLDNESGKVWSVGRYDKNWRAHGKPPKK